MQPIFDKDKLFKRPQPFNHKAENFKRLGFLSPKGILFYCLLAICSFSHLGRLVVIFVTPSLFNL